MKCGMGCNLMVSTIFKVLLKRFKTSSTIFVITKKLKTFLRLLIKKFVRLVMNLKMKLFMIFKFKVVNNEKALCVRIRLFLFDVFPRHPLTQISIFSIPGGNDTFQHGWQLHFKTIVLLMFFYLSRWYIVVDINVDNFKFVCKVWFKSCIES